MFDDTTDTQPQTQIPTPNVAPNVAPVPAVVPETPESLHARAMTHLHNARNLYLQQLQSKPPTPEHHKMGLGIMAAALAAAALDPTRNKSGNNAGTAFYNHYKAAQQQGDEEANQGAQSRYQRQAQIGMARSGFETEDAARDLQDKKDLEDQADSDKKDARQSKLDDFNETMKKAALDGQSHRAEIAQKAKDIAGYQRMMNSPYPFARMLGIGGLRAHIAHDRPGVQEAGYDPSELEKMLDEAQKTASNPSPKDQAGIDLSTTRKKQIEGKTNTDALLLPGKLKDQKAKIAHTESGTAVNTQRQKNLQQTYEWAPRLNSKKLEVMDATINRAEAMATKAKSVGKKVDPNDKWIVQANRVFTEKFRTLDSQDKEADKTIKAMAPNVLLGNADAIKATDAARKQKSAIESTRKKTRSQAAKVSEVIFRKSGIPGLSGGE